MDVKQERRMEQGGLDWGEKRDKICYVFFWGDGDAELLPGPYAEPIELHLIYLFDIFFVDYI